MNHTTKRFARTLHEAFGPYTSRRIEDDDEPMHEADLVIVWGCAVIALAVTACIAFGVI
jgi:hypothetical protein